MEAETDGMKSAALWRGSPGAKILLSHIPINPTRRLGSLSHHSKDPHGSPPYLPHTSVPPLLISVWVSDHSSIWCLLLLNPQNCLHSLVEMYRCGSTKISSSSRWKKNCLYDHSYWKPLRDGLYCHFRVQIVFWPKTWEKHCTIHLH